MFARLIGQKMSESTGSPVIIDNRPGLGGLLGLESVVQAPRSTPTLGMLTTGGLMMAFARRPDLVQGFQMVSLLGIQGMVIVSPRDKTIADFVERAKGAPQLSYGSSGSGSMSQICFEQFLKGVGRKSQAVHVPYRGAAPLLVDLMSGQVEAACVEMSYVIPQIRSGKLRALAVTLPYPHDQLPGVPTLESAGVQGVLSGVWYAAIVPKGISRTSIDSMVLGLKRALSDPQVQARLRESIQADPIPVADVGPEIADQFLQRQIVKLAPYSYLLRD